MSMSSRPDHFFQTTTALDENSRKSRKSYNTEGSPIKLPSKLLAITPDPIENGAVYIAESTGIVERIALKAGTVTHSYKGAAAPLASLCLTSDGLSLFAGCWDKTIWTWSVPDPKTASCVFKGHTDFVKALSLVRAPGASNLLVSGGAEGDIIFWDLTGHRQHVLKCQSRGIQDIIVDPFSSPESPVIFAATSGREIYHFNVPNSANLKSIRLSAPIIAHETSVYKLFFDSDGDMWTASADKTVKHLVREDEWRADMTLQHPDFVRDVVLHEQGGWVVTACRDEDVRVWNRATGELHHIFSGHFEEVTGLCLVGDTVVSVSIDSTIRQWSLAPGELLEARERAMNPTTNKEALNANPEATLTEEEERELQELMENEERELQELMSEDLQ